MFRWIRNGALALVALVVAAVIAGVIAIHTDWGRDYVRQRLVASLAHTFRGPVSIGRLEGSPFGTLVARDIVIDDAEGRPAVYVDRVALHVELLGLVRKQLHISTLEVDGVTVLARDSKDGRLNLAELTYPNDTKAPGAWGTKIDQLVLRDGKLDYAAGGQVMHLDDLSIDGGMTMPADEPMKATLQARAKWREKGVPVIVGASLSRGAEQLELGALQASAGEIAIVGQDVKMHGARVSGRIFVAATAHGVQVMAPGTPIAGDTAMTITLHPVDGPEDARLSVIAAGMAGGATFSGGGLVDPNTRSVKAALRVRNADGARFWRGAPETAIDALALVDVVEHADRHGVAMIEGGVHLVGAGGFRRARFDALDLGVATKDGAIAANLKLAAPGRTVLALDAHAIAKDTIELRDARLRLRSADLASAARGVVPVRGAIEAEVTASGRIGDGEPVLAAQGRVNGTDLRLEDLAAKKLALDLDATGLPYHPTGRVHVDVAHVTNRGQPMMELLTADARSLPDRRIDVQLDSQPRNAPWRVQLGANVGVARHRIDVALGDHRLRTKGLDWSGHGGTIVVDDTTVTARGITSHLATGQVAVDATYHRAGARQGDADAKVTVAHLDLAEIDRAFGLGGVYHGTAEGTAKVSRQGTAIRAQVDAAVNQLIARFDAPPVDVRAKASVAPGDVRFDGDIKNAKLGDVAIAVAIDAPHRIDDVRAWRRLDRHAVRSASVTLTGLDVKQLAAVAGDQDATGGRIDGKLTFDGGAPAGKITAKGIAMPELPSPLDLVLSLATDARAMTTVGVDANERGLATAKASAILRLPDRPFDPIAWRSLDPHDVYGAHLRVDGDLKDQELVRKLGLASAAWHGKASVDVDVAAALAKGTMIAKLAQFHGGPIVEPIDGELAITVDPNGIAGRLTTVFQKRPLVEGQFGTSTKPAQVLAALRSGDPRQVDALPVRGQLTMERIRIGDLLHALGRSGQKTTGEASLAIAVGGTVGETAGKARLWFDGLGTEDVVVDELSATATWQGPAFEVQVKGDEKGGGTLSMAAKAELGKLETASAKIQASKFDLAPIARLLPPSVGVGGVVDADMDLTGASFASGKVAGRLHVAKGQVPINPVVGTLHGADIEVKAQGDGVTIAAKGDIGRGTIDLKAQTQLVGLLPVRGAADVTMKQITMINEAQPKIDGIAHIDLGKTGDTWNVNVDMRRVFVTLPDQKGNKLHPPGKPGDVVFIQDGRPPPKQTAPPPKTSAVVGTRPRAPYLIATVDIGQVRIESKELRGLVMGKLRATIGEDAVAIDGAIDAGRCDVTLSDRRYRVDHAYVRFDGSADPLLDVRLVHDFSTVTLYVTLQGRMSNPRLELSSDPNTYSQSELLGFLMGGEPGAPPAHGVADVAAGLASSFLSNKVKGYAEKWTGVSLDVLKFEAATSTSSAALTIGKWVSQKLFVEWRQRVDGRFDENASEAEVEYWLGRRVVIDGTAGDRGVDGVDLIWTRRW
ncbi:MAG TPA: translocation/assembly module TamB domain-containing protein [Kofleriaceae bacterium]|nr:translocation/assembly module TamB domain-containing protein [Kofleriaceae bacterium]